MAHTPFSTPRLRDKDAKEFKGFGLKPGQPEAASWHGACRRRWREGATTDGYVIRDKGGFDDRRACLADAVPGMTLPLIGGVVIFLATLGLIMIRPRGLSEALTALGG